MPIIKQNDIYDVSKGKPLESLKKEFQELLALEQQLIEVNKKYTTSLQQIKQTNSGTEAKKLVTETEKLKKSTTELTGVQKERIRVATQLQTTLAKVATQNGKQNQILAKGKLRLQENNKLLKQQAKEALGLVSAYDKLTKKTNDAQRNFKNLATQFGVNSKQAQKAKVEFDKLDKKLSNVNSAARDGKRDIGRYGISLKGLGKQLLGAAGVTAGAYMLVSVIKNGVKVFKDFDKATSGLSAILMMTKDEISSLTEQAKKLGSTTAFTASQVIEMQTELARLGYGLTEIENATPAMLDLAAAVGVNLADAAQVAGGIIKAFGLDASDSREVVDALVATTNNSGAAFEDYREAVKLSAPIFKAANIDFKTMNLLIGNLADSQIKGSLAGTGLKNLVSKLSDENSSLSKELGFTVKNSDDLVRAFGVLKEKNIDLTEATELTDERSKAAFLTLIEGVDSTDKLSLALKNLDDNARKTAETMLDNLAGDMTKATSAWEGLILSIADGTGTLSEAFRGATQTWTEFLGGLQKLNEGDFTTKLKVIANSVTGFLDIGTMGAFSGIEEELENLTGIADILTFNTEKLTASAGALRKTVDRSSKSLKENTEEEDENANAKKRSTDAIVAANKALKDQIALQNIQLIEDVREKAIAEVDLWYDKEQDKIRLSKASAALRNEALESLALIHNQKLLAIDAEFIKKREEFNSVEATAITGQTGQVSSVDSEEAKLAAQREKNLITEAQYQDRLAKLKFDKQLDSLGIALKAQDEVDTEAKKKQAAKDADWLEVRKQLELEFITASADVSKNAFNAQQDEKVAKARDSADAQIAIAQNRLDKGLITEAEFQRLKLQQEGKVRKEQAKAQKRAAYFGIAIDSAAGIIKTIASVGFPTAFPLIALIAGTAAIQAGVVASTPVPSFGDGEINIDGKPHSQGGKMANIEGGESVITKLGTSNAPNTLEAINKGLLSDNMVLAPDKNDTDNLIASLLMTGNKKNDQIIMALANLGYTTEKNGMTYEIKGDGTKTSYVKHG